MSFRLSEAEIFERDVQKLLNRGLFWSLVNINTLEWVRSYSTREEARRAKTRKTRVIRTAQLISFNYRDQTNGKAVSEKTGVRR